MIRFGGLATGQDTQTIVDTLLEAERIPIYRLENEIVEEEEKYSAWTDLDTKASDLNSKISKLTSYLTWRQNDVGSSQSILQSGPRLHGPDSMQWTGNMCGPYVRKWRGPLQPSPPVCGSCRLQ